MSDANRSSIYTKEEQAVLDKVKKVRLDIIDSMTEGGVPDRSGDIRVLNEVMSATDKMITDSATIRLKQDAVANGSASVEIVAELLKQARANKQKYAEIGGIPEITQDAANVDLVSGEADINPEALVPDEFVAPHFDPNKLED